MICHRGRLREARFEVPGFICKDDFWILDSAGKRLGTFPLEGRVTCSGCRQSYANTEWPTSDVCESKGHCDNVRNEMGWKAKERGYKPALAGIECARYVLCTYRGGRMLHSIKVIRNIARVLDASFTILNWDHLAEVTGYDQQLLAVYFCSVPSLGERLNKKGASFVPWATESGIILGDYIELVVYALDELYVIFGQAVIEIHTGLKIKFEEDENGVTHVIRGSEDFSEQLPVGDASRCVLLG